MIDRVKTWTVIATLLAAWAVALPAAAHEDAKTKIDPSILLDITAPRVAQPNRAFDESIKTAPKPADPKTEWKQRPDGSYQYGNTTIIIRHDCPPGGEFFEPPPLPGRRR